MVPYVREVPDLAVGLSCLFPLLIMPFSIAVAPERLVEPVQILSRPTLFTDANESALESEAGVGQVAEGPFTLHPNISFYQLSERARRPSTVRNDSDRVSVLKDGPYESSMTTVQVEDVAPTLAHAISYPPRPTPGTESVTQRKQFQKARTIHMIAACWCFFVEGWNDGSTGPLLPVIQRNYGVDFTIVSLLFVFNCAGFIIGAGANLWLMHTLGFGKAMALGSFIQFCAYVVMIPAPPFPVLVLAYFMCGFGMSIQNAQVNGFVGSSKENKSTRLGILHASYGFGAFMSPFSATHFSGEKHWSFHYIISASLAIFNILVLCYIFRFKRQDELLAEGGQEPDSTSGPATGSVFNQIRQLRVVHLLAIFAIIYIGVEVTVGGWIVTFIIEKRGGGPEAGYISSGFFGGLALGRIGLIWLNKKIGEYRAIFVYSVIAIGYLLEITIWFVPSIIENFIAVAFIGILLGPMFPIIVSHASRIVPHFLLTGCVGWITGLGMSGSAALPFITGIVAAKYGIGSLQPLMVIMMCIMVGTWALVPKGGRRVD